MDQPIFLVRAHSFEEVFFGAAEKKIVAPTKTEVIGQSLDPDKLISQIENAYEEIDDIKFEMLSLEEVEQGINKKPKIICWFKYGPHGWEKVNTEELVEV